MNQAHHDSGYCWYVRTSKVEINHFISWEMPESSRIILENIPNEAGERISVLRIGNYGLIFKIRDRLKHKGWLRDNFYLNSEQKAAQKRSFQVFVRRSSNGPLQPWPRPGKKRKAR